MLSIPGLIPAAYIMDRTGGLVLKPCYLETRIWDGAGNPGLYNLVELEMASCCIGP